MSQENVEVVRRIIDAINQGEVNAAFGLMSPDFEADWSNSRGPQSGVYRGRDQTGESWRSFLDAWASVQWDAKK